MERFIITDICCTCCQRIFSSIGRVKGALIFVRLEIVDGTNVVKSVARQNVMVKGDFENEMLTQRL
jgi:hypothetical protein